MEYQYVIAPLIMCSRDSFSTIPYLVNNYRAFVELTKRQQLDGTSKCISQMELFNSAS